MPAGVTHVKHIHNFEETNSNFYVIHLGLGNKLAAKFKQRHRKLCRPNLKRLCAIWGQRLACPEKNIARNRIDIKNKALETSSLT